MNMPRNVFVAVTVAQSWTNFYFSQWSRQQKNCETSLLPGNDLCNLCRNKNARDKLQEKLPSVWHFQFFSTEWRAVHYWRRFIFGGRGRESWWSFVQPNSSCPTLEFVCLLLCFFFNDPIPFPQELHFTSIYIFSFVNSGNCFLMSDILIFCHSLWSQSFPLTSLCNVPVKSKLQHLPSPPHPPSNPRAFEFLENWCSNSPPPPRAK